MEPGADLPGVAPSGGLRPTLASGGLARYGADLDGTAALLLAAAVIGQRRVRRRWLMAALLAGALFQILFGAQQWFARTGTLWGWRSRSARVCTGPSSIRTTWLYLEMALPLAFAGPGGLAACPD